MVKSKFKRDIIRSYQISNGSTPRRILSTLLAPGIRATAIFRFGQWAEEQNILIKAISLPIYFLLNQRVKWKFGIDISKSAKIGEGFYIGHYGGIFIAPDVIIGDNVSILQQVIIKGDGQGKDHGAPTIGDDAFLAVGCKIIGKIKLGNNVRIGANVIVCKDLPDNTVLAKYPGFKIISYSGNRSKI